jgi:hypothetical protein
MADGGTTGTTAAPNSTTGAAETAVVPDAVAEKPSSSPAQVSLSH